MEGSKKARAQAHFDDVQAVPLVPWVGGKRRLADRLIPLGYRNLRLYMAGYPDWTRQGRPVRKGAQR